MGARSRFVNASFSVRREAQAREMMMRLVQLAFLRRLPALKWTSSAVADKLTRATRLPQRAGELETARAQESLRSDRRRLVQLSSGECSDECACRVLMRRACAEG